MGTKTKTVITIETRKVTLIKRVSGADVSASINDAVECSQSEDDEAYKKSEAMRPESQMQALMESK